MIYLPSLIILKYILIKERNDLLGHPVDSYLGCVSVIVIFFLPVITQLST